AWVRLSHIGGSEAIEPDAGGEGPLVQRCPFAWAGTHRRQAIRRGRLGFRRRRRCPPPGPDFARSWSRTHGRPAQPLLRWSALALFGLLALAIAGTPASAQKSGGTLVQITQPEPPNLAPYISTSAPIGQVTAKVYDGLLEYGFDLKPKPSLAERWEVAPDGKTVTFHLRKDVKFHDGKPFTTADVAFPTMTVLQKF